MHALPPRTPVPAIVQAVSRIAQSSQAISSQSQSPIDIPMPKLSIRAFGKEFVFNDSSSPLLQDPTKYFLGTVCAAVVAGQIDCSAN